jgi:cytochrome o ubiquinol oxidase subunit 1
VHDHDSWYDMKNRGYERPITGFKRIHMPKNTGTGLILSVISIAFAFAMIWYIWWLAIVSFIGLITVAIGHTFNYNRDFYIPAETVSSTEDTHTKLLAERT